MNVFSNMKSSWNAKISSYQALDSKDKKTFWKEALINNAMYILILVAIIYTQAKNSYFLKPDSIVNIISLSAANIPIACGIAGCIVLTGTDLSAGRVVGLSLIHISDMRAAPRHRTRKHRKRPRRMWRH